MGDETDAIAASREWGLLTGYGTLRELAIAEQVDMHGVLWLFDQLADGSHVGFDCLHGGLSIEINLDGLLRGDILSRYRAYAIGRNWGWLSADEVREFENFNPLPDGIGRTYLVPTNMDIARDDMLRNDPPVPQPRRAVLYGADGRPIEES